jgi:BirA family biotin operon repressor/biotin-[acetyl-CoA-carboxylase] ligase
MDQTQLERTFAGLPIGPLRYFDRIGSTNDEAARWADAGAPELAIVIANEQTAGRGRLGRKWHTAPNAALAFSLVLRDRTIGPGQNRTDDFNATLFRLTALGALSVCQALQDKYALQAQIKWPNDVLLGRHKVAGVLTEAAWHGDQLDAIILGVGVNITQSSVPDQEDQIFPATCVETILGRSISRSEFLYAILQNLLDWRTQITQPAFLHAWMERLAFRGEWVSVALETTSGVSSTQTGQILGLDSQGFLRLRDGAGNTHSLKTGEIRLRLLDTTISRQ